MNTAIVAARGPGAPMVLRICILVVIFALRVGAAAAADALPAPAAAPDDPVLGQWTGSESFGGDSKPIGVRFERYAKKNNTLVMYYDNPQMKFYALGPAPVTRDGATYTNGYFRLTLADGGATLSGIKTFDGHELPVVLRRGEAPPRIAAADFASVRSAAPVWTFRSGGPIWSAAVATDGSVYFGSNDNLVYALAAESGATQWRFATGGAVVAGPTVAAGALYAASDDGRVYKLDRRSGKLLWKSEAHAAGVARAWPSASSATYDYLGSAPLVSGDTVYVGSADHRLYALDARSGAERWHFDSQGSVRSSPARAGRRIFFGSYDHNVYALDARTGKLLWKHDTLEPVVSSTLAADDSVYIGSRSSDLFAFDARTGKIRWDYFYWSSWVESSARMRDGTLYIGSSDYQQVFALDARTGTERWRSNVDGSAWSTPAVTDARIYIGVVGTPDYFIDHHGGFFALERATGKPVWRYPMPALEGAADYGVAASPVVAHGLVLFGGLDGVFYAFKAD